MRHEVANLMQEFRRGAELRQPVIEGKRPLLQEKQWFVAGLAAALTLFTLGIWVGTRLGDLWR